MISGKTALSPPPFVKVIDVISAEDMYFAVVERSADQDIIIKSAAVADYRPAKVSNEKIKKSDSNMIIQLERTTDILKHIGEIPSKNQYICGFSMETQNLLENSRIKLIEKNIDMIVANDLKKTGAGFNTDTNIVTIITKNKEIPLALMSKDQVAEQLLSIILTESKLRR